MFADACEKAAKFTRPVIISTRSADGEVHAGCAAFVVLNDEGWIVTAGHIFDSYIQFQQDQKKIAEIRGLNDMKAHRPKPIGSEIKMDPKWITNHSFWWSMDGVRLVDAYVNRQLDICVGRLDPFDPHMVGEYPVFRDPERVRPGTSLCRLGFPFQNVESEFDENSNAFRIKPGVIPMTLFPNDGIYTRNIVKGKSIDGGYNMQYLETSTPGLKGQSGGPIYDKEGRIVALQVQTSHLPLGFQPSVEYNGEKVVENQFLNVGLGVHVKTLVELFRHRGIRFTLEGEESGFRIRD